MKRPMLIVGASALLVSVAAVCNRNLTEMIVLICALLVVAAVVLCVFFKTYRLLILALIILTVAVRCRSFCQKTEFLRDIDGDLFVTANVTQIERYSDNTVCKLRCDSVNGRNVRLSLYADVYNGVYMSYGDSVRVALRVKSIGDVYDLADGVCGRCELVRIYERTPSKGIYRLISDIRTESVGRIFSLADFDSGSMLAGISTGNRDYLSPDFAANVRRTGVSHVMVVSGLHLSILISGVLGFLRKKRLDGIPSFAAGIVMLSAIAAVAGLSPSIMRAGLVYFLTLAGIAVGRRADALNSFFFAAVVCLIINPYMSASISFQLSMTATFGVLVPAPCLISVYSPRRRNTLSRRVRAAIIESVCVTLCATVMTLPVTLAHFKAVSVISVISNLLITYTVTASLMLAVTGLLVYFLPAVSDCLLFAAGAISRYNVFVINTLGEVPFAYLEFHNVTAPFILSLALCAELCLCCCKMYDRRDVRRDRFA